MSIEDDLRRLVRSSERSLFRVAREAGLSYSRVHDFVVGGKTLSVSNFLRLASGVGYNVKLVRVSKRRAS